MEIIEKCLVVCKIGRFWPISGGQPVVFQRFPCFGRSIQERPEAAGSGQDMEIVKNVEMFAQIGRFWPISGGPRKVFRRFHFLAGPGAVRSGKERPRNGNH